MNSFRFYRFPGHRGPHRGTATTSQRMNISHGDKRQSSKKVIVIGLVTMLVSGLLAIILALISDVGDVETPSVEAAPARPKVALRIVKVPSEKVLAGTKLSTVAFRDLFLPEAEVPEDAVETLAELEGKFARIDLVERKPILRSQVSEMPTSKSLQASIPPGHRATTIMVDATGGVEAWAVPGVHVDVLVSYVDPVDKEKKTQIAVEDAVVLSVNGQLDEINGVQKERVQETPGVNRIYVPNHLTVTLSVPFREALTIQNIKMLGTLSLLLRNSDDPLPSNVTVVSDKDLEGDRDARAQLVPAPRIAPPVIAPPKAPKPDGSAKFTDSRTGESVEFELRSGEWFRAE